MISALYYWKNYTLAYIINGALNDYEHVEGQFYEGERIKINEAVSKYIATFQV